MSLRPGLVSVAAAALLAGCRGGGAPSGYTSATGGDPAAGRAAIRARHCGACHQVPHVTGAAGVIGPSLEGFSRLSFIAGTVPNTPANLIAWIRNPRHLAPRTAMPTLGLGEDEARNVAAYLYTLR
ncbi:MAG TPA: c-type cytochrome [Polyangia bacterium]|nr:c-type cytochrome [Polyangia bacterium]